MQSHKKEFIDCSFYLNEQMKDAKPFAAGKIGNCELMCIYNYFLYQHKNQPVHWDPTVVNEIYNNTGVFPQTENARLEFIQEIINCLPSIDSLALWSMFNQDFEYRFIKKYSKNCELIEMQGLEPFYSGSPWTEHLANKNVLVISPFTDTIKVQYEKRQLIWKDSRILPEFNNLYTLKHPHSPGIDKPSDYTSWLNMVQSFKSMMDNIDYDILLVGTGASSLPLIAHAKTRGKKGIHLGGPLQLLFGIKGSRWDNGSIGRYFYNEYWVKPSLEETPEKFKNIEGGCYW